MNINPPRILVIAGPTASGKSDLAISLARRLNGEIISADSRQVYRGMNIGTGKVTKLQQRQVHHWLIDVASPKRSYTVAHFKRDAQNAIRNIIRRGKLPIICGGTGFWIDALIYDQPIPAVTPDPKLRAKLQTHTPEELFEQLKRLDPARASTIDRHNPVRLIRALEIVLSTGKPVPLYAQGHLSHVYDTLYLVLNPNPATLQKRIAKRLDARLRAGMVAEVRRLHTQGVSYKRLEALGLEYRWVAQHLQGKLTRTAMRDGLLRDIIRYSKRQLTWWRRDPSVQWVTEPQDALRLVARTH